MKYVILQPIASHATRGPLILATCQELTHHELVLPYIATHAPSGAGFFEQLGEGGVRTFGYSVSLGLGPSPHDARILEAFIRATLETGRATESAQPIHPEQAQRVEGQTAA